MKKSVFFAVGLIVVVFAVSVQTRHYWFSNHGFVKNNSSKDSKSQKLLSRTVLEREGRLLVKAGRFEEAIIKYQEAMDPQNIAYGWEEGLARGMIRVIYIFQGNYEEAMKALTWHLEQNPSKYDSEKKEIIALMNYQKTGDPSFLYDHINYLREHYKNQIPPVSYNGAFSSVAIVPILRLYNLIGDHAAGIRFVDEILNWAYSTQEDLKKIQHVSTANEALRIGKWDDLTVANRDPEWRAYKFLWQYLTIREAFEQDKREGFKGCAHSKPGEVCMGRATKALIQSDYFPW